MLGTEPIASIFEGGGLPSSPTLTATPGATRNHLKWSAPAGNGATIQKYLVKDESIILPAIAYEEVRYIDYQALNRWIDSAGNGPTLESDGSTLTGTSPHGLDSVIGEYYPTDTITEMNELQFPATFIHWFKVTAGSGSFTFDISGIHRSVYFYYSISGNAIFDGSSTGYGAVTDGWHMAAIVFNGTTETLWIDGERRGSRTAQINVAAAYFLDLYPNGSQFLWFNASLDANQQLFWFNNGNGRLYRDAQIIATIERIRIPIDPLLFWTFEETLVDETGLHTGTNSATVYANVDGRLGLIEIEAAEKVAANAMGALGDFTTPKIVTFWGQVQTSSPGFTLGWYDNGSDDILLIYISDDSIDLAIDVGNTSQGVPQTGDGFGDTFVNDQEWHFYYFEFTGTTMTAKVDNVAIATDEPMVVPGFHLAPTMPAFLINTLDSNSTIKHLAVFEELSQAAQDRMYNAGAGRDYSELQTYGTPVTHHSHQTTEQVVYTVVARNNLGDSEASNEVSAQPRTTSNNPGNFTRNAESNFNF